MNLLWFSSTFLFNEQTELGMISNFDFGQNNIKFLFDFVEFINLLHTFIFYCL